jgi:membrane protease YdiL (CAAX protease family)
MSIIWALYLAFGIVIMTRPNGLLAHDDAGGAAATIRMAYIVAIIVSLTTAASGVAMLRRGPRWLEWTGCLLALIPLLGPCGGLTIPIAIWLLLLLRSENLPAATQA